MNEKAIVANAPKILLVDDNLVIQRTVALALKNKGYEVCIAADISTTLSTVRQEKPDLILLDLTFPLDPANVGGPSQDGLFVIQWLQRTPEAKNIPIIIISGQDPAKYKDHISNAGIAACFRKPLNHGELLSTINEALATSASAGRGNQD
jgi:DNA-binding response OmpR family regulator